VIETAPFKVRHFTVEYRMKMITAYPTISGMTTAEMYGATGSQLDEAFLRVLDCRNLARTHRLWLESRRPYPGFCQACFEPLEPPNAISCRACGRSDADE
jgi:hypothetical protein